MEMTMRWFGKDYDTVTLEQIKQTRYATGIITTLYNKSREKCGIWMKFLQ